MTAAVALLISGLIAVIVGLIASHRGRPFGVWFVGGLIFWPLWLFWALRLPRDVRTR